MNTALVDVKESVGSASRPARASTRVSPAAAKAAPMSLVKLLSFPVATLLAFAIHALLGKKEPPADAQTYALFLYIVFGLSVALASVQAGWSGLRRWVAHMFPIFAAAMLSLCVWQIITTGLRLLPLPYFPAPSGVFQSIRMDAGLLADSARHSLVLLFSGYFLGVAVALVTGVCIGWFPLARYWGMPLLKVVGPIPATAWIPLAMILSPSGTASAIGLVALAVWFPVTMLTISGIANTRASYLDVARTLGAGPAFLIFRVAIPAAMPSIFIGLFMGLGTSFITLIVAETVGVKSGLGWYIEWARGWAEYGKVYGALMIMAAFFSTIMTLLFKVRDRVLVWQKGAIKW